MFHKCIMFYKCRNIMKNSKMCETLLQKNKIILYNHNKKNLLPIKINENKSKSLILYKAQNKELMKIMPIGRIIVTPMYLSYKNKIIGITSGLTIISTGSYGYILYCNLELLCFIS